MWKRSDRLLREYQRTNKRLLKSFNKFTFQNLNLQRWPSLVRGRERRKIRNYLNYFVLMCFIGLPNPSLYRYGRPGFHYLGGHYGRQALIIRPGPQKQIMIRYDLLIYSIVNQISFKLQIGHSHEIILYPCFTSMSLFRR